MDITSIGERIDLRGIVEQKIDECSDNLKQYLPQNFVFLIIYDGVQRGISQCLLDTVSNCTKKIQEALQSKTSI